MFHKIKRSFYKLKKYFYRKHFIGMAYEKESYNTCIPPVIVQTYIVIRKQGEIYFIKYKKITTSQTYYDLVKVLHSRGYQSIDSYH